MAARTTARLRATGGASDGASPVPFWLDSADRPAPLPPFRGEAICDLLIVGGGFTGLWAAIDAKERDPGRDVLLVEAHKVGGAASGRNGGFLDASLTHGLDNAIARFPDEVDAIRRQERENFDGLLAALERFGIDARVEHTGEMSLARRPHEVDWLRARHERFRRFGVHTELVEGAELGRHIRSPVFVAGLWRREGVVLVDPARLAWGLRDAALGLGVRIHEGSPMRGIDRDGPGVVAAVGRGRVRARRALIATNGFPGVLRAVDRRVVPVYDYVLVTEPLTDAQRAEIGWDRRQGLADASNRFHYFRLTPDDRILWGGYDAVYHFGRGVRPAFDQRPATFRMLESTFAQTFPQLDGIGFTHRWGGVIDTSTRFCVNVGTVHRGRVAYAAGYTGLGVGASRFGAAAALDLLDGLQTERTELGLVRTRSIPWPPEPFRWLGIEATKRAMEREDRTGRRGAWLRLLDAFGLGFDS
jgi:glycine/D-amino acid oxidase-like deaminating enzyme